MLGQVMFDLQGYAARLSQRPMAKNRAQAYLTTFASEYAGDPVMALQFQQAALDVAADQDPLSDQVADEVQSVVLTALGDQNVQSQALAADVAAKKDTYEAIASIPRTIGEVIGRGAGALASIAGDSVGTFVQSVFSSPWTVLLLAAGGYYLYTKHSRRSAAT